ncbi:hypothetical protein ABFA07_019478 [Porites harrisoni]
MKATVRDIIILNILVATFLFVGAGIFHALESPNQYGQDHQFYEQINQATLDSLHKNLSVNMLKDEFDNLVKNVFKLKVTCPSRASSSYNWTYSGSLYFSANVITTIGYGHMTPSTFAGRMFCIFYALVGIPLCMLTLKVMGDKINELLGSFFIMISTKRQLRDGKGTEIKVMLTLTGLVLVFLFLGGTLYLSEDWSYFDGVYYCFIALSTIGFGDMVPTKGSAPSSAIQTLEYIIRGLYLVIGLVLVSSLVSSVVSALKVLDGWDCCRRTRCVCCQRKSSDFSDELGPKTDGLHSVSSGLDTIVFPSVIPFRRFASDEVTPLIDDPRWLY